MDDENVQMLLDMGFPDPLEIRRALRLAKNDVGEAVAILTHENPTHNYDVLDDVEMKDVGAKTYGPGLPPSYEEIIGQVCKSTSLSMMPVMSGLYIVIGPNTGTLTVLLFIYFRNKHLIRILTISSM